MSEDKPAVDKELIRELAKLLDETGLTEIEFERVWLGHSRIVAPETVGIDAVAP